ncbi:flavoprotein-like protein [Roridomyces roridus]|uniref:Flavoprotein-like protein n=1 Tax=Roridomyces roridus TaxID=1738132 RepID=A0AAD7CA47_9AGAR|nr:flavoprotein-like protein [Roridomyces roridus]
MTGSGSPKRIALIIGSTRTPRIGPAVADFIANCIVPGLSPGFSLTLIDLTSHPLPLYTEDAILPASLPPPPQINLSAPPHGQGRTTGPYSDHRTNAWSSLIRKYHAFIFLTPQYNAGYPACLKLALDALYWEWRGKPAVVMSYGMSHGGGTLAAAQLRQVLRHGLQMRVCQCSVGLAFGRGHRVGDGKLGRETAERWVKEGKPGELIQAVGELVGMLDE